MFAKLSSKDLADVKVRLLADLFATKKKIENMTRGCSDMYRKSVF
jgi:hypothetical protein